MFDDDCIYCMENPTTDPNMSELKCMYHAATDKKDADNCAGIMNCRYYAPKNKVGTTPYKHEDLKDYYNPDSKLSDYDWDLNCNLENTVRNEKGENTMSDLGDMKDRHEPIPDCAYSHDDDLKGLLMCSKWGGPDTCIGYVNCSEYRPKGEEKPVAKEMASNFDVIHKPSHYTEGRKYEPKDVIRDWDLNFNLGNTVKYVARAGRKDDILQDLKKARQYLDFEIEYLEKEREEK